MFHKEKPDYNRCQYGFYTIDELVPEDHFLRQVEAEVDFDFIYDLVEETYSPDQGRPSLDPVMLVKIPLIQCFYGIRSMRQTIKDIEVNVAYRWFLGLSLDDKVPHFTTYGKNYSRRFQDKALITEIFSQVLHQSLCAGLIDSSEIFVDGTPIKAAANSHKYHKEMVAQQAKFMSEQLEVEIDLDRRKHEKKSLKPAKGSEAKEKKISRTDPESGWFHKGEHKEVFAYSAQVACDKHGWALAYTVEAGNVHDSQAFPALFAKIEPFHPTYLIADAGYKTQVLTYRTTTRAGYREYKSEPTVCVACPLLSVCTQSQNQQKVITRHVWKDALECCEEIRHQRGMKELYKKRKETIERLFGTAKEYHNLRYTRERGKSKMEDKVGLTLACLNLKKLVKMRVGKPFYFVQMTIILSKDEIKR